MLILEQMLRSQHRTSDPDKADYFVVPIAGGPGVRAECAALLKPPLLYAFCAFRRKLPLSGCGRTLAAAR